MAHAFDNRNFIPGNQPKISHSGVSQSDVTHPLWERSSSPKSNHHPPTYEESVVNQTLSNHRNSKSSTIFDDSSYHQTQSPITDDYVIVPNENHSSETKPPPPPARMPRLTSTTNHNYIHRANILPQYSSNGIKTNTTYLNATQLYITQPSRQDPPPPPPPPRHPLHPPAIPPRNSVATYQKNSITIPDFNSSKSPKTIYRSPVLPPTVTRNGLEQQSHSLSIAHNHHDRETTDESTVGEYFGQCCKCGETVSSSDGPCDILGQIYHSSCAVCVLCGRSVKNKHFFVKDQLYCEEDFLYTGFHQSLEHCVACDHLITDTILQALGDSYHLACFKCSKCSICLDGLPFIRDKKRNLFCLHDYHLTYGPRCDKCSQIICPENDSNETVRIISMNKTFHVECYQCEDCSMQLGDEQDRRCYPLNETLLCQECCRQRLDSVDRF